MFGCDDDPPPVWGMTALSNAETLAAAGPATVRIRLQHDFRGRDLTFDGTTAGTILTSLTFGDRVVFPTGDGIPTTVLGVQGTIRGFLCGQELRAGLDITAQATLLGPGTLRMTATGWKPVQPHWRTP